MVVGITWILVSDQLLNYFVDDVDLMSQIQTVKGWFYICATALLLFWLVQRQLKAIKESEERWQFALDGAHDGVWDWNVVTNQVFFSTRYKEMLGFAADEFENSFEEWEQRIHPDDREAVFEAVKKHFNHETALYENEHRLRTKDGSYKWILARGKVFSWTKEQTPLRMIGTHTDISERKQTETELGLSRNILKTIIDTAPMRIFWKDKKLNFLGCNPAFAQDAGLSSPDEIIGKNDYQLSWSAEADSYREDDLGIMERDEEKLAYEEQQTTASGQKVWLRTSKVPLKALNGDIYGVLGLYDDITEQKQVENTLQRNHDMLSQHQAALLALTKEGVSSLDETLNRIITVGAEQLNVSRVGVWVLNESNTTITCKALYDQGHISNEALSFESKDHPRYFEVLSDFGCISANDAHHHSDTREFSEDYLTPHGITSMLDTPIRIQGKVIGIICCEHTGPIRKWTVEEEDFSRSISELCALTFLEVDRKEVEEQLQLSARVFKDTHEGITITDADRNIIDVNPAFCEITGYSREDVIGQNPSMLHSGKQSSEFYQNMWQQVIEKGYWQGEVWNRKKDGEIYAELLTLSILKDDNDNIVNYLGVLTDITNSKKQQEQLSLMAHYDGLTGLPNRALFTDRFAQAIAHSKRTEHQLAICFLDLDNFKPVNDNYGHEIGDQLLIEVAQRITSNIREEDTVSRQGGDEFTLLLNDIETFSQCEQTLQRIHQSLAQPFLIDNYSHKITASTGVTLYPNDDGDIDTLLRHADQAMYHAKLEGKHRYQLFNPEHDQRTIQKNHQLGEIDQALINNEFELYYQPKVNMVTGDVFGAEALIRWLHPEKGLIPPLDFLPIIEKTELELKIGHWVINEALSQIDIWNQQGIRLEVSINISSHHLLSETFFAELDTALAKHPAVDSQTLQLEILESSALGDLNTVNTIIETCQVALGVQIALDDFGTGYSSLTHLRSLPADTIKIDQSFVRDMLDDPSDYAIIDGIIGLSDSFNREVIAEGVETTNHGLMLLVMGCEEAQGYGIAKPMPAADYPQWLKAYTPNQAWQQFGHKHRSIKENKVELFRLVTQQWKERFINTVHSSAENGEHRPIMNSKRCPCGSWLKREKQEQVFESASLEQLNQAHEALHLVAQSLPLHYQEGDEDSVRHSILELQTAFDSMSDALEVCE
mgnify:CR=1 FL=1